MLIKIKPNILHSPYYCHHGKNQLFFGMYLVFNIQINVIYIVTLIHIILPDFKSQYNINYSVTNYARDRSA